MKNERAIRMASRLKVTPGPGDTIDDVLYAYAIAVGSFLFSEAEAHETPEIVTAGRVIFGEYLINLTRDPEKKLASAAASRAENLN